MSGLRQITAVTAMNLRAVTNRLGASLVIVGGMAIVAGVALSVLSVVGGLRHAIEMNTRPGRIAVVSQEVPNHFRSRVSRSIVDIVSDMDGIQRDVGGGPLAMGVYWGPCDSALGKDGKPDYVACSVGVGKQFLALYPEVRLVEGRMFTPGLHEMIVGKTLKERYFGFEIGDEMHLQGGIWKIVGVYDGWLSGPVTDADTLMAALKQPDFSTVVAMLAGGEPARPAFALSVAATPNISVRAEQESEMWRFGYGYLIRFYSQIAYWLGGVMTLGALFGAVNTMYGAVSARTGEIATLRAIGFGPAAVVASVMAESALLACVGMAVGAGIAWMLFDGTMHFQGGQSYKLVVDYSATCSALLLALAVGALGALLPAIRAARLPVATALQVR